MERVPRREGVSHIGLVLNRRGFDRAVSAGVDEVNVVVPASDGFAKANQNSTTETLTEVAEEVVAEAASTGLFATVTHRDLVRLPLRRRGRPRPRHRGRATLGRGGGEGDRDRRHHRRRGPDPGAHAARRRCAEVAPDVITRAHFHNTRNTGYANAVAALRMGRGLAGRVQRRHRRLPVRARPPPATSPPRTSSTCSNGWACRPDSTSTRCSRSPAFLSDALGYRVPALLPRAGTFPG